MLLQEFLVTTEIDDDGVRGAGCGLRSLLMRVPSAAEQKESTEQQECRRARALNCRRKGLLAHEPLATRLIVQPKALVSATGTVLPACRASIAVRKSWDVMPAGLRLSSMRP